MAVDFRGGLRLGNTDPMRLFYASGLWYEPNELVHPGSWGRVVLGAGFAHSFFGLEMTIEHIRKSEFADQRSRLRSLMAAETKNGANDWRDQNRKHIYELETDQEAQRLDVGWLNKIMNATVHSPTEVEACIRNYWSGLPCPAGQQWELLIDEPARVVRRC